MLWAKKLEEVGAALKKDLTLFLKTRIKELNAAEVADDLVKTAIKIDMSRSATRLRRRLYAQWGKYDIVGGEFVQLGKSGLQERPLVKDPEEVGDLHVDPFRVISVVKMLGMAGKTRLSNPDRVKGVTLILKSMQSKTRTKTPPLSERAVGVLMALHAVEANREVPCANVEATVQRFFAQWELPRPADADIAKDLEALAAVGAIKESEDQTKWRLSDRLSLPW